MIAKLDGIHCPAVLLLTAKLTGISHPAGSELTVAHATRSKIDSFGIQYEGKASSSSQVSWAA
jgi:hypothetical protein